MKKKLDALQAREELREWLVRQTGCNVQRGKDRKSWPCGTCFVALLQGIGLNSKRDEYQEHNKPVDRINEVWRAILQIRDAKLK